MGRALWQSSCKPLESSPSAGLSLSQSKALLCLWTLDFYITKKNPNPGVSFGYLEVKMLPGGSAGGTRLVSCAVCYDSAFSEANDD